MNGVNLSYSRIFFAAFESLAKLCIIISQYPQSAIMKITCEINHRLGGVAWQHLRSNVEEAQYCGGFSVLEGYHQYYRGILHSADGIHLTLLMVSLHSAENILHSSY